MATHDVDCPACGSKLRIYVQAHLGGGVEENVGLAVISEAVEAAANLERAQAAAAAAQADAVTAAKALIASTKGKA